MNIPAVLKKSNRRIKIINYEIQNIKKKDREKNAKEKGWKKDREQKKFQDTNLSAIHSYNREVCVYHKKS